MCISTGRAGRSYLLRRYLSLNTTDALGEIMPGLCIAESLDSFHYMLVVSCPYILAINNIRKQCQISPWGKGGICYEWKLLYHGKVKLGSYNWPAFCTEFLKYTADYRIKGNNKINIIKHVLRCSVMSDSLRPPGLQPTRPLWFSWQEHWSGLPFPPSGDLPLLNMLTSNIYIKPISMYVLLLLLLFSC